MRWKSCPGSFIDSLNDAAMELAVHQAHGGTLESAVRVALEYEAFCEGRENRHLIWGQSGLRSLSSMSEDKPGNASNAAEEKAKKGLCYSCRKPGH